MTDAIVKNGKYGCPICDLEFSDVKTWEKHTAGKKHQQILHQTEFNRKREENGLYITGFPLKTPSDSIRGFLRRFGEFSDFYHNEQKNYVLATFTEKRAAEEILNYPSGVYFNKRKLRVQRRRALPVVVRKKEISPNTTPKKEADGAPGTTPGVNLQCVLECVGRGGSLERLLRELEASPAEKAKYQLVIADLQQLFGMRFRSVTIHPFGSTRTGLNLKGSDVDVFVEIGEDMVSSDQSLPPPEKLVRIAQKMMFQNQLNFHWIRAVTRAKTPIVKFVHRTTRISCDVSFKNMLAVANSQLLRFYVSFDPRVYPFFMIIKYWARVHQFSGCGKMSNYALVTIAAFYLQQLQPPVLPTVLLLQENSTERRVDGWKCNFAEDLKAIDSSLNTMTVMELLGGFFKYFQNFNIAGQVMCSLTATVIPKASFVQTDTLPNEIREEYIRGMESRQHGLRVCSDMVVQDPFELTHNLTASMGTRALQTFMAQCTLAAEVFEEALKIPDEQRLQFLKILFTQKVTLNKDTKGSTFCLSKSEMQLTFMAEETISIVYTDPDNIESLTVPSEEEAFPCWLRLVYKLLQRYFENIMMFQVEEKIAEATASKVQKVDTPSDVHATAVSSSTELSSLGKKILYCKGNYCLWEGRRKASAKLKVPSNIDSFQVEEMVTKNMFESLKDNDKAVSKQAIISFTCEFIPLAQPSCGIKLVFKDQGSLNKNFNSVMLLMSSRVPYLCTKYMKFVKHRKRNHSSANAKSRDSKPLPPQPTSAGSA